MTIEFPKGALKVDRTFNTVVKMFGGGDSTCVVGSCVVDGDLLEFGVTFSEGWVTSVSASGGRSFDATPRVAPGAPDDEYLKAAKQAVLEMMDAEVDPTEAPY